MPTPNYFPAWEPEEDSEEERQADRMEKEALDLQHGEEEDDDA